MCGFAGIQGPGPAGRRAEEVGVMLATLAHRGPDGERVESLDGIVLGHRRLAIIDLSERASQPMGIDCPACPRDGKLRIVTNGEFYNHVELRMELEARGHRFHSASDTEVPLHLYGEMKDSFLEPLRGMFALALWDGANRRLILARDRMGQKPLYYRQTPGGMAFASEVKALAALARHRGEGIETDAAALRSYLALKYVPGEATGIEGIHELPPAHMMILSGENMALQRYWDFPPAGSLSGTSMSQEDMAGALEDSLREAVRIRMRADVPLGLFLSGGLDSGVIGSLMTEVKGGADLLTFTIGFDNSDYDETRLAALTAAHLGAEHREIVLRPTPAWVTDELGGLAWQLDKPFADSSALAVHHLAREVRRHVTVALSGDGGDELFLGYDRHRAHRLASRMGMGISRVAGPLSGLLDKALKAPPGRRNLKGRALRFFQGMGMQPAERNDAWITCIGPKRASDLLTPDFLTATSGVDPLAMHHEVFASTPGEPLLAVQKADMQIYLVSDILQKVDAATMTHALEARAPMLDHHVVEAAMRIPVSMKLGRTGPGKRVLRDIFAPRLPREVVRGRKAGFGLPLDHWLRDELHGFCRDLLLDTTTLSRGIFRREGVERLLDEHRSGSANHEDPIWTLVMLEQWFRSLVDVGMTGRPAGVETASA